jgi:plastocyanin
MSSPHSHNEESKGYSPHMRGVALGILVMGVSLAAIIILWATIGYQGPDFSTQAMERQQDWLHEQYGLPPVPELSPEMLQVPPSLRNAAQQQQGEGGAAANQTGGAAANQTGGAAANQTGGAAANQTGGAAANQTTGGGGGAGAAGGPTINILEGSSVQGSPDYDPEELTASAGSEVTVVNQDTLPHSATSGTGPQDPESAQLFDTSLINGGESATLSLAQVSPGQYDYYCIVHPYMTGKVVVQ